MLTQENPVQGQGKDSPYKPTVWLELLLWVINLVIHIAHICISYFSMDFFPLS